MVAFLFAYWLCRRRVEIENGDQRKIPCRYMLVAMKVGVFTPLLSQLPLDQVLTKLKSLGINTVELGTGNYPGDAHCKLSMLDDASALREFQAVVADHGFTVSALSCHG